MTPRLEKEILEAQAKEDYRDATRPAVVAGNPLSHTEAGRVLVAAGERLHSELFGPEADLDGATNAAELLIFEADGSRYRTTEGRAPSADPGAEAAEEDGLSAAERDRGWRENKVAVVARACPGRMKPDGEYQPPEELVKTYVATTGSLADLEHDLELEARRRGATRAREVVAVSDNGHGLPQFWVRLFAVLGLILHRVTDFFHCSERLADCAQLVHGEAPAQQRARRGLFHQLRRQLWNGQVDKVLARLRKEAVRLAAEPRRGGAGVPSPAAQALWKHIRYFEKYKDTMDYPAYRARGWPMASGSIESACGQFGLRVKHGRMRWTRRNADALHVVKAAILSGDDRWAKRWPPPIPVLELPLAA